MLLKLTKYQKLLIANVPVLLFAPDAIASFKTLGGNKEFFHKKEEFVPITSVETFGKFDEIIHCFKTIINKKPVDIVNLSKLLKEEVTYKDTLVHLKGQDECLNYFGRDHFFEKYFLSFDFFDLKNKVETYISSDTLCLVYKPDTSEQDQPESSQYSSTLLIKLDKNGQVSSITNNFLSVPLISDKTSGLVGKASKLFEYKRRLNAYLFLGFIGLWNLLTNKETLSPTEIALERPKPKKNLEKDI